MGSTQHCRNNAINNKEIRQCCFDPIICSKEQMLHFPYYFQIHNIQRCQKALSWSKGLIVKKRESFLMNKMDLNFNKIFFFVVNKIF